jgi:hypothetical protein
MIVTRQMQIMHKLIQKLKTGFYLVFAVGDRAKI